MVDRFFVNEKMFRTSEIYLVAKIRMEQLCLSNQKQVGVINKVQLLQLMKFFEKWKMTLPPYYLQHHTKVVAIQLASQLINKVIRWICSVFPSCKSCKSNHLKSFKKFIEKRVVLNYLTYSRTLTFQKKLFLFASMKAL